VGEVGFELGTYEGTARMQAVHRLVAKAVPRSISARQKPSELRSALKAGKLKPVKEV
jgi:hypothetical protein